MQTMNYTPAFYDYNPNDHNPETILLGKRGSQTFDFSLQDAPYKKIKGPSTEKPSQIESLVPNDLMYNTLITMLSDIRSISQMQNLRMMFLMKQLQKHKMLQNSMKSNPKLGLLLNEVLIDTKKISMKEEMISKILNQETLQRNSELINLNRAVIDLSNDVKTSPEGSLGKNISLSEPVLYEYMTNIKTKNLEMMRK